MAEYHSKPHGDNRGVLPTPRERPPLSQIDQDTPSSSTAQLTPEVSTSESGDGNNATNLLGRGTALKKLQTDLPGNDGDDDGKGSPLDALLGSDSIDFGSHSEEDDDDDDGDGDDLHYYTGRSTQDESVSKSFTAEEERRVVKKFDRKLTLFMALLYLLSFLDRSNIGNAKIAGMAEDLRLSSSQYEWVLTAFYITYIAFEWMTLMYRLVPAHIYIPLCVGAWGLMASFQCVVTSFWVLFLLRALLGISEAAFGPGLPFYLSFFYKREELAFRTGLFVSAAPLATSFAGSLAWLIVWLSKDGPIAPWRALFLVEGFPSVIVASIAWAYIPDGPGKALYLTPRERKVAKVRLKSSEGNKHAHMASNKSGFDKREVGRTLRDPKAYLTAFMFFSCNVAFSSLPVFLPTILNDMGYSTLTSQALSAPPYLFSFITVLFISSLSDRSRTRSPFVIAVALCSAAAYITIAVVGLLHTYLPETLHILIRYVCVYPAAAGFFTAITLIITWTMDNQPAKEGKGTGMAILNIIGQCGPLVGTRLYPASDGPWYVRGMAMCSLFMVAVAGLAYGLRVLLKRENERSSGRAVAGAPHSGEFNDRDEEGDIATGEAEGLMAGHGDGVSSIAEARWEKPPSNHFTYII